MDHRKELKENIERNIKTINEAQEQLKREIEELYNLEKGETIADLGWKRKGRELGFVL